MDKSQTNPQQDSTSHSVPEQDVVDYLRLDTDFFSRHPGLLSELNLPHVSGKTVSLIEHQVAILRERNVETRRKLNQLLQTAQSNEAIFGKTRALTLALLDAKNLQALNEVLATHVLVDFEADFVCCHLVSDQDRLDHIHTHKEHIPFLSLIGADTGDSAQTRTATLRPNETQQVFPSANLSNETTAGSQEESALSASAIFLPLDLGQGKDPSKGMLCIGSRNANHFMPDMDTLFVVYIADVLGKVLINLKAI